VKVELSVFGAEALELRVGKDYWLLLLLPLVHELLELEGELELLLL
jgi:hypothetical protein